MCSYVTTVSVYNSILDVAIYSNKSSIIIELNWIISCMVWRECCYGNHRSTCTSKYPPHIRALNCVLILQHSAMHAHTYILGTVLQYNFKSTCCQEHEWASQHSKKKQNLLTSGWAHQKGELCTLQCNSISSTYLPTTSIHSNVTYTSILTLLFYIDIMHKLDNS